MKIIRSIIILSLCCFVHFKVISQVNEEKISDKEWDNLIDQLVKENWSQAEKLCLTYLDKFSEKDDSLAAPAIIRYMYLRCVGAKLGEKKYGKEEALEKTKKMLGKTIITPPKEFIPNGLFNCFSLNSDSSCFISCSTNEAMTVMQINETYKMADPEAIWKARNSEYNKKNLRLGARIKEINTVGYMMARLTITFENAFIWDEE